MNLAVVVPFKSFREGKSRLAPAISAMDRQRLCAWMLGRTISLAAAFGNVLVVSGDSDTKSFVESFCGDVEFLKGPPYGGLNHAIDTARECVPRGSAMLVLPIDLVHLGRCELLNFTSDPKRLSISPDRSGEGTNLLYLPPSAVTDFQFHFGPESFFSHLCEARLLGFDPRVYLSPASSFDLDTPADLVEARIGDVIDSQPVL